MVTITGSFFSTACCFWQPAAENAAPAQASNSKIFERQRRRRGEDGKADDVAFLLMVPLNQWEPLLTAARRG
ncbi:hypothetical protein RFM41_13555 [Mesorhizobium sp. VK25A]|uniref:Secreted protein n=1 Tax=Mesorhizobium vachelliae TaxID=3072309 RepID=A0ABU5A4U7_9HYPH|nr:MULTISPECIES: hypothetical protein [unclassified Mesorhizobium]MDX8532726.1 hypothetical protein [Mesorhizobium sp. VK25D]MDX8544768.1 hypothetical protein [Mesorhizobium sp. VK25A]